MMPSGRVSRILPYQWAFLRLDGNGSVPGEIKCGYRHDAIPARVPLDERKSMSLV